MASSCRKSSSRKAQLERMLDESQSGRVTARRQAYQQTIENKLLDAYVEDVEESRAVEFKSEVRRAVKDTFTKCQRVKVSERHLRELEDKVRFIALSLRSVTAFRVSSRESKTEFEEEEKKKQDDKLPRDDFQTLMEFDIAKHITNERRVREMDNRKKTEVRHVLDLQLEEKKKRLEIERKEAEEYGNQIYAGARAYEKLLKEKKQKAIEDFRAEKEQREKELKKKREIEKKRKERKRQEEDVELQRIRKDLEEEEQKKRDRIAKEQEQYAQFAKDLEQQKIRHKELQQKLWEEDIKRDAEYAEMLAKEDKARREHLQQLKKKSQSNQEKYLEATADSRTKAAEEQERIERVLKEREIEEEKRAADVEARRKTSLAAAQAVNKQLIERKMEEKAKERSEFQIRAKLAREAAAVQHEAEKEKVRVRKKKSEELRAALDRQVKEKKAADEILPTKMSKAEISLNADIFRDIPEDPRVYSLVKQNFKPQAANVLRDAKQKRKANAKIKTSYFN